MRNLFRSIFRRNKKPVEIRPNRAARRRLAQMKPGEQAMRFERAALKKANRKAKRGYNRDHVRSRAIYLAAYKRGMVDGNKATVNAIKATISGSRKHRWAPRFLLRGLAKATR